MIALNVKDMIHTQQRIFLNLKKEKERNRLSHAYLFYGDDGVGKKEMAYALACLFYCPDGGCLDCETCRTILEGKHLNVNYVGIQESKKLISKEQITELQEEFSKTSLVDGYRIYIVEGIDTASASAQNSLLKFIEEPVNQTPIIGIFIAKELANVVSTIVSRCALVHFPSIDILKLKQMLQDAGVEELDAGLTALITNNPEEAKSLLDQPNYVAAKEMFCEFLPLKTAKEAVLFYLKREKIFNSEMIRFFFTWLIAFYEDIFKLEDKDSLILTSLYDKMLVYMKGDYNQLKRKFSLILELYSKIDYNITAKNIFHELISKLF